MQKQSIVIEPHKSIKEFRLYLLERENVVLCQDLVQVKMRFSSS